MPDDTSWAYISRAAEALAGVWAEQAPRVKPECRPCVPQLHVEPARMGNGGSSKFWLSPDAG